MQKLDAAYHLFADKLKPIDRAVQKGTVELCTPSFDEHRLATTFFDWLEEFFNQMILWTVQVIIKNDLTAEFGEFE